MATRAADGAVLLTKMSLDSIDTAAIYLINVIDRLQEDPHEPRAGAPRRA